MKHPDIRTSRRRDPDSKADLQYAGGSMTAFGAAAEWNAQSAAVQHYSLQSKPKQSASSDDLDASSFIFLAEDNPADACLVRTALQEHGVTGQLMVITDGEASVAFVHALDNLPIPCPDLMIVDLNLPKRSGKEVLEAMRKSQRCNQVPAIVLSSSDMRNDKMEADRLGANRYIQKPLRLDEFIQLGAIFKEELRETQG